MNDTLKDLILLDHHLFNKINAVWTHPALDQLMPIITDLHKVWWFQLGLLAFLILWVIRDKIFALKIIGTCILAIGLADVTAYRLIKKNIQRDRPHVTLEQTVQLHVKPAAGFSFPSNHAANMFALATILSFHNPFWGLFFYALAALIAYSRIYVGVHFPIDVLAGALVGHICGRIAIMVRRYIDSIYRKTLGGKSALPNPPRR